MSTSNDRLPSPEMPVNTVDHHDMVLGTMARKFLLSTGHNFRVAHLFLSNSAGEILLQQLARTRERHPLAWGASVACYLFAEETSEEAIHRRVVQELGCEPREIRFVAKTVMHDVESLKFIGVFAGRVDGPFNPDPTHIERLEYVPATKIGEDLANGSRVFTPTFRHIFGELGDQLRG
jgi:isopentenyl-diphosphate delta-isomerase